jgi:hypothetical protein
MEGVNYSSARIAELDERDTWRGMQQFWIEHFCQPIYEDWLRMAWRPARCRSTPARLEQVPRGALAGAALGLGRSAQGSRRRDRGDQRAHHQPHARRRRERRRPRGHLRRGRRRRADGEGQEDRPRAGAAAGDRHRHRRQLRSAPRHAIERAFTIERDGIDEEGAHRLALDRLRPALRALVGRRDPRHEQEVHPHRAAATQALRFW